jgi:hypothetical protein
VFKSVVDAVVDTGMIVLPSTFRINSLVPLLRPDFCALPSHARQGLCDSSYWLRGGGIFCGRRLQFSASCPGNLQACTGESGIPDPACYHVRHKNSSLIELCRSVSREANRRQGSHRQGHRAVKGGTKNIVQIFIFLPLSINIFTSTLCHPCRRNCRRNSGRN